MISCPKCSHELPDDNFMIECPQCRSMVYVDGDGTARLGEDSAPVPAQVAEPASDTPAVPEASPEEYLSPLEQPPEPSIASPTAYPTDQSLFDGSSNALNVPVGGTLSDAANDAASGTASDSASDGAATASYPLEATPQAFPEPVDSESSVEKSTAAGGGGLVFAGDDALEDAPEDSSEAQSMAGRTQPPAEDSLFQSAHQVATEDAPAAEPLREDPDKTKVLPNDPLGLSQYANSAISQAKDGPLLLKLCISGIDTKEMRNFLRQELVDPRLGLDAKQLMTQVRQGVLIIENISPLKASVLLNRLKRFPLDFSWEQYGVTQL